MVYTVELKSLHTLAEIVKLYKERLRRREQASAVKNHPNDHNTHTHKSPQIPDTQDHLPCICAIRHQTCWTRSTQDFLPWVRGAPACSQETEGLTQGSEVPQPAARRSYPGVRGAPARKQEVSVQESGQLLLGCQKNLFSEARIGLCSRVLWLKA